MKDGSGSDEGWRRRRSDGARGWRDLPLLGGHVDDLAAGFALGALDPAERRHVEGHRRVCPVCDRRLVDDGRVVALLPLAVPPVAPPPPDVKVALLARVAHATRAAAPPDSPARPASGAWPTPTLPSSRPSPPLPASAGEPVGGLPPRRRWPAWSSAVLALPLLLALIGTSVWAVQLRARAEERGERANSFRAILERALEGDGAVSELAPGPAALDAEGWVVTAADGRTATVYVRGAEARAGQWFELFGVADGKQISLKKVKLDDRGRGVETFLSARPLGAYRLFRVKVLADGEPAGLALFGRPAQPAATPVPASGPGDAFRQSGGR